MGRPKIELPEDPILARAHEGNPSRLPPPRSTRPNAPSEAALLLARKARALRALDQQLQELNEEKSKIYKELRKLGYSPAYVRQALKDLRVAPEVLEERKGIFSAYWTQLRAALDALGDDE
jgi:uncharacterized protein (UPF0335 family)